MSSSIIYSIHKETKEHRLYAPGDECGTWHIVFAITDGWIPWDGGECPLPRGHMVDVRYRDGQQRNSLPANMNSPGRLDAGPAFWRHDGVGRDIVAYRPLPADGSDIVFENCTVHRDVSVGTSTVIKPEPPAWSGEGECPPVGSQCLKGHARVLILAYADVGSPVGQAVVYQSLDESGDIDWAVPSAFSPIHSEEERFVDEVNAIMQANGSFILDRHALALYRAGLRFTDGEES